MEDIEILQKKSDGCLMPGNEFDLIEDLSVLFCLLDFDDMGIIGSVREDFEEAVEGRSMNLAAAWDLGRPVRFSGIVLV